MSGEAKKTLAYVHGLESFGLVDGPGVRYIVFLQGCHMRCQYCHNPETWRLKGGKEMSADEIMEKALRYKPYWRNNGGITVSGGEPLLQIDFLIEFFRLAHEKGIHTTLDTSGNPFDSSNPEFMAKFEELMKYTDLIMLDLKEIDPEKHKILCAQPNENIFEMARWLSDHGKLMWIRHVLVPDLTDDEEGLRQLDEFIRSLNGVRRVEILPYHTLGVSKWHDLGIKYPLEDAVAPTPEQTKKAEDILHILDYPDHA